MGKLDPGYFVEGGDSLGDRRRQATHLVPEADGALERLKYSVAQDLGLSEQADEDSYAEALDRWKYEVAEELGLDRKIQEKSWANMTSRECGRIGGQMGGRIGGQMVRRMVKYAERNLK